jgi:hypothetical protein
VLTILQALLSSQLENKQVAYTRLRICSAILSSTLCALAASASISAAKSDDYSASFDLHPLSGRLAYEVRKEELGCPKGLNTGEASVDAKPC